jgi:hypothetical protein
MPLFDHFEHDNLLYTTFPWWSVSYSTYFLGDPAATPPTLTIASVVFRGVSVVLT